MTDKNVNLSDAFAGKVVWITGASSGIGEGMALAFAKSGAHVVLSGRKEHQLERVSAACQSAGVAADNLLVLPLDVVDYDAMPSAVASVIDTFGRIDLLINNAGLGARDFCLNISLDVYRTVWDVNVMGPIALTKQVLPVMIEQGSGHVAVTSSVAGKVGVPLRTAYCAAKHGVIGFFDALRTEVAYHGVKVSCIIPGLVKTGAVANALKGDGGEIGADEGVMLEGLTADEAAALILPQLARQVDEFVVGECDSSKMVEKKRENPIMIFRGLEQMAEQALYSKG